MVNVVGIVIVVFMITAIGGGGFYLLWLKTRPKKQTWNAKVYQIGEGIRPAVLDKNKNVVSDLKLNDLKPYTEDVIERIDKDPGITLYRLQRLNKTVESVPSDCVDYWGENKKEVAVVIEGETCTILKKGYDKNAGIVFQPMPHDRINMITSQIALRKDRLKKEKDILQAITPWIVTGICMLSLIVMIYITVDGWTNMSEMNSNAEITASDNFLESTKLYAKVSGVQVVQPQDLGQQEELKPKPPSVE